MKVALVHHRLAQMGGLESRLMNYAHFFLKRGDDVHLYFYKKGQNLQLPEGLHLHQIPIKPYPKPFRRWAFNQAMNRHYDDAEFDFSLSLERTAQQKASIAPGDHKGFLRAMAKSAFWPKHRVQMALDQQCFNNSTCIYPCSPLIAEHLSSYYHVPTEKMCTLFPPLNTATFNQNLRPHRQELRNAYGMHPEKFTYVMASVSHKRKGVYFAEEIFGQLQHSEVELLVAGLPQKESRYPNVRYLGYVPHTAELFTAADALLHPALYEPAGQIIAESLACGTPVLLSNKTGWSPSLSPAYGEVVNGFEPAHWRDAISRFAQKTFAVAPNFAEREGLSLEVHMARMLAFYTEKTGMSL